MMKEYRSHQLSYDEVTGLGLFLCESATAVVCGSLLMLKNDNEGTHRNK